MDALSRFGERGADRALEMGGFGDDIGGPAGLDPADGPGLVFVTLPLAFGQMPGGIVFATLFFVLLTFAAWTSAISLMEPAVAWLVEKFNRSRSEAAVLVGGSCVADLADLRHAITAVGPKAAAGGVAAWDQEIRVGVVASRVADLVGVTVVIGVA